VAPDDVIPSTILNLTSTTDSEMLSYISASMLRPPFVIIHCWSNLLDSLVALFSPCKHPNCSAGARNESSHISYARTRARYLKKSLALYHDENFTVLWSISSRLIEILVEQTSLDILFFPQTNSTLGLDQRRRIYTYGKGDGILQRTADLSKLPQTSANHIL
jgi:hypothetical protein